MSNFLHREKKLRPNLDSYSMVALIPVFGHHFGISTHIASDHAKGYVQHIRKAFGNIEYLSHI